MFLLLSGSREGLTACLCCRGSLVQDPLGMMSRSGIQTARSCTQARPPVVEGPSPPVEERCLVTFKFVVALFDTKKTKILRHSVNNTCCTRFRRSVSCVQGDCSHLNHTFTTSNHSWSSDDLNHHYHYHSSISFKVNFLALLLQHLIGLANQPKVV